GGTAAPAGAPGTGGGHPARRRRPARGLLRHHAALPRSLRVAQPRRPAADWRPTTDVSRSRVGGLFGTSLALLSRLPNTLAVFWGRSHGSRRREYRQTAEPAARPDIGRRDLPAGPREVRRRPHQAGAAPAARRAPASGRPAHGPGQPARRRAGH